MIFREKSHKNRAIRIRNSEKKGGNGNQGKVFVITNSHQLSLFPGGDESGDRGYPDDEEAAEDVEGPSEVDGLLADEDENLQCLGTLIIGWD